MKYIKLARQGHMAKIGESEDDSKWFHLSDPVKRFIRNIKLGDEVEIETKPNTNKTEAPIIVRISKLNGTTTSSTTSDDFPDEVPKTVGVELSRDESIMRQVILKAVATTISSMPGLVDLNNVQEVATSLFKFYQKLVKE